MINPKRLKAALLISGIQKQNHALFQVIDQLIDSLNQTNTTVTSSIVGAAGVNISGTPTLDQIAIWINNNTIKGDANFKWDGSQLLIPLSGVLATPTFRFGSGATKAGFYSPGTGGTLILVTEDLRTIQWSTTGQTMRPGMFWVWNAANDFTGITNEEFYSGRSLFSDVEPTLVIDGEDSSSPGDGAKEAYIGLVGYSSGWASNYARGLFGVDALNGRIIITGDRSGSAPTDLDVVIIPIGAGITKINSTLELISGAAASELRLKEPSGSGVNYTGFKSPALAGDVVYTLPNADGNTDDVLKTDGSKNLSWAPASGVVDGPTIRDLGYWTPLVKSTGVGTAEFVLDDGGAPIPVWTGTP